MSNSANPTSKPESSLEGLRKCHEMRRTRTVEVVSETIKSMQRSKERITLGRIVDATKSKTGTGKSISASTILRNAACRDLYEKAATPKRKRRQTKGILDRALGEKPSEAETRRMAYLFRLTKGELAAFVVNIERELHAQIEANNLLRDKLLSKLLDAESTNI